MKINIFKTARTCLTIYGGLVLAGKALDRFLDRYGDRIADKITEKIKEWQAIKATPKPIHYNYCPICGKKSREPGVYYDTEERLK